MDVSAGEELEPPQAWVGREGLGSIGAGASLTGAESARDFVIVLLEAHGRVPPSGASGLPEALAARFSFGSPAAAAVAFADTSFFGIFSTCGGGGGGGGGGSGGGSGDGVHMELDDEH